MLPLMGWLLADRGTTPPLLLPAPLHPPPLAPFPMQVGTRHECVASELDKQSSGIWEPCMEAHTLSGNHQVCVVSCW
jgi:hypothetical protein